jgi:hypothetical protein
MLWPRLQLVVKTYKGAPRPISPERPKQFESEAQSYFRHLASISASIMVNFGEPDYEIIGVPTELYQPSLSLGTDQNCLSKKFPVLCADGTATSREQLLECWRRQGAAFGWETMKPQP